MKIEMGTVYRADYKALHGLLRVTRIHGWIDEHLFCTRKTDSQEIDRLC